MLENKLNLLTNARNRSKFCAKLDRAIGCRQAHYCEVVCPFWIAANVEYLYNEKRIPLGEALRLTIRESITKERAMEILKDVCQKPLKEYPDKETRERIIREVQEEQ